MSTSWKRFLEGRIRMSTSMPIDVLPCSNGEYLPGNPTPEQLRIMQLQDEQGEIIRRRLGMSRRDFVRSAAAYGVGIWAMSQVIPPRFGGYYSEAYAASSAPPSTKACDVEFKGSQLNNLPGEFIFDVQSHHIDSGGEWRWNNPGFHAVFAAIWEQSGPLGGRPSLNPDGSIRGWGKGGELDPIENLSRYHYIKELYLDSSTNMTVLSAVPSEESKQPLPCDEAAMSVGMINQLAGGTQRCVMHAFVMPNRGSYGTAQHTQRDPLFMKAEFDQMERHVAMFGDRIRGWKVYTPWGDVPYASGWFLDDEVGLAFINQVRKLGDKYGIPKVIAAHKGFALPAFDQRAASPRDIGPAAKQNPDVNFIVYHSGYDNETQTEYPGDAAVNSADRGVNSLIKSLRENGYDATRFVRPGLAHGNVPNVYAEIGATMRQASRDSNQLAHLLGKLITYVGPQRVVWGTDSLWFGSPQPEIVRLRTFEFTQEGREKYNLPYGLNGDRFDPRVDALNPNSYRTPHPAHPDWPTDGRAHPERTIRNGIFGRNAAVPYRVDPDAQRGLINCDEVQKIRDAYILNEGTEREMVPGAANMLHGARTDAQLMHQFNNEPFLP